MPPHRKSLPLLNESSSSQIITCLSQEDEEATIRDNGTATTLCLGERFTCEKINEPITVVRPEIVMTSTKQVDKRQKLSNEMIHTLDEWLVTVPSLPDPIDRPCKRPVCTFLNFFGTRHIEMKVSNPLPPTKVMAVEKSNFNSTTVSLVKPKENNYAYPQKQKHQGFVGSSDTVDSVDLHSPPIPIIPNVNQQVSPNCDDKHDGTALSSLSSSSCRKMLHPMPTTLFPICLCKLTHHVLHNNNNNDDDDDNDNDVEVTTPLPILEILSAMMMTGNRQLPQFAQHTSIEMLSSSPDITNASDTSFMAIDQRLEDNVPCQTLSPSFEYLPEVQQDEESEQQAMDELLDYFDG